MQEWTVIFHFLKTVQKGKKMDLLKTGDMFRRNKDLLERPGPFRGESMLAEYFRASE